MLRLFGSIVRQRFITCIMRLFIADVSLPKYPLDDKGFEQIMAAVPQSNAKRRTPELVLINRI